MDNMAAQATRVVSRRDALGALGAAGAALALGCGGSAPTSPSTTVASPSATVSTNGTCVVTPTETVGPFPSLSDIIRSDVRENKQGAVLSLTIKVVNTTANCANVTGAQVEIWQCDAAGNYSQYGSQTGQTYLRGIQTTNGFGEVNFTTIYPGWYQGRATHIHIEVSTGGVSRKVTQIAFPESTSNAVHATGVYASRGSNPTTNAQDNVFSDGFAGELVNPSGNPLTGYAASFQVALAL